MPVSGFAYRHETFAGNCLELPCRKVRQCSHHSHGDRRFDVLHGESIRQSGIEGTVRKWERNLNTNMHLA